MVLYGNHESEMLHFDWLDGFGYNLIKNNNRDV